MQIDQRNAGASVTPAGAATTYTLDRWNFYVSQSSKLTAQRSTVAPSGFINSLLVTSSSAYSVTSGDEFDLIQYVEGLNIADLAWGTASASPVTLSFWVRSSLTGTFGGAVQNGGTGGYRSYPFSYTINSANTWEQKSITVVGDTSGTWATTNAIGLNVAFGLGQGSNYSGTANAWVTGNKNNVTGATSVVGTNGATFYITGVQLEKGSTATSFDYRPYGTELALCQRYYFRNTPSSYTAFMAGFMDSTTSAFVRCDLPTTMRASPTFTQSGCALYRSGGAISIGGITNRTGTGSGSLLIATTGAVAGDGCRLESDAGSGASGYVEFSAEL
jgi:hypothetical protein